MFQIIKKKKRRKNLKKKNLMGKMKNKRLIKVFPNVLHWAKKNINKIK